MGHNHKKRLGFTDKQEVQISYHGKQESKKISGSTWVSRDMDIPRIWSAKAVYTLCDVMLEGTHTLCPASGEALH